MAPPSGGTTSVQVAVRIRPTTSHDTISIPARFQRTVVQVASATTVQVDATTSAPNAAANGGAQAPASAGPSKKQLFTFDQVHPPSTSQHTLFQTTAEPLLSRFLQGFNCTILAYGQTSSGKTYSMTGVDLDADPSDIHNGMGIIPRAVSKIFEQVRQVKQERGANWTYSIKGSFIEIYNEDLIDLLGDEAVKREVQIREDKDGHIIWGGLREVAVRNAGEVMSLIRQGTAIRRTNETDMNAQSSRSHAIFSLTLTQKKFTGSSLPTRSSSPLPPAGRSPSRLARPGSAYNLSGTIPRVNSPTSGRPPTPSFHNAMSRGGLRPGSSLGGRISPAPGKDDDDIGEWVTIVSKFHFVDLAGSERLKRTAAQGERIKEGISINSGLLALGNVISALGDPARAKSHTNSHIPYRDSKLTRLLQDSLGGNANTLMIACVSPAEWNAGETINTLKYANRARNIRNRAVINEKEDGWDDVEWLQNMVTKLRRDLKALKEGNPTLGNTSIPDNRDNDGSNRAVLQEFVELQSQHDELRQQFFQRAEELNRLRRELSESQRATGGNIPGSGKYEEIVGPVIEEYEKTIASMEAELSLNRAALRHTNNLVIEKEEELAVINERHTATELYLEELRARVAKLAEREASTEAYVRDLEEKIKAYDEKTVSSSSIVIDLRRELQQYKERESHSAEYIADLEQRLSHSDEGILSLRERVQQLETEVESRLEAAELLQRRLDELTADGRAWRNDLEEREAKLKQLENQLEVWEEKKRMVAEERERLDGVVDDVAKARHSLEIDMQSTDNPLPTAKEEQNLREQLSVLQETHQATLSDLAAVTDKYRDALREISDLAAQIQEAKLQASIAREPSDDGSDRPVPPTPRRRLTTGGSLRSPRSGDFVGSPTGSGRRSFFRQAASTESLHARSLSQSQSLSQELSSARLHRPSLNGRPDGIVIPSPTLLSPVLPRTASLINDPGNERSAASLEKEIMRLQEVLKEREAEINNLEQSLKEKTKDETAPVEDITPIPEGDDQEPELQDPSLRDLSPTTLKQFKDLRRLSRRLSLQKPAEHEADPSETLGRLNELMLSMAQKESQHREIVETLNTELSQIRRQHDELSALSRGQALNMSTELEALRKEHVVTASQLEELQLKYAEASTELENQLVSQANLKTALAELRQRELDLLVQLEVQQNRHVQELDRLRSEHEAAIQAKDLHLQSSLENVQQNHNSELAKSRRETENAIDVLAKIQEEHENTLSVLRAEHATQLEQRSKEVETFMGQSQTEQAETLSKLQGEHAQALKKEIEDNQARLQELREEHGSAINKLAVEYEETLKNQEADSLLMTERLRKEQETSLSILKAANDGILAGSQSKHAEAIQALQTEHSRAIEAQHQSHEDFISKIKGEYEDAITELLNTHAAALEKAESNHASTLSKLREELLLEISTLQAEVEHAHEKEKALLLQHSEELTATRETTNAEQTQIIKDQEHGYQRKLDTQVATYESSLSALKASHKEDISALEKSHIEEIGQLTSKHASAISNVNSELASVREEHRLGLEAIHQRNEAVLTEVKEKHAESLAEMQTLHENKCENLLKDHDLLLQEVAAYKSAMDEFTISRQQTQEAHEETTVKQDLLIAALEEEVATIKAQKMELLSNFDSLKAELETTRARTSVLVQEASNRDSLAGDLERHRSLLGEVQINLQKTRDERDNLAAEKNRQDELLRQLQAQLEAQPLMKSPDVATPRPVLEHRSGSITRVNGIPPPMTPPPAGPPPPTPGQAARIVAESVTTRSSAAMSASSSSRGSQVDVSTPGTSISAQPNGQAAPDPKLLARIEEQTLALEEKEAMIKTLNKQLTHCEGDLQAHMDLVTTLGGQLNDSERNLRKARLQATELSKERDRLNAQVETVRNELQEAKREVANVRRSIVEEKQSLEHRLDEERKAKERARAQLDSRMEELQKRKSKFACM